MNEQPTKRELPPLPKDPQHQRYADLRLRGYSQRDAYVAAGYADNKSSSSNARKVEDRPDVQAYMQAVNAAAFDESVMSTLEKRQYFARAKRVPITAINLEDPKRENHDLIKELTYKVRSEGPKDDPEEWVVINIKKVDPLRAIDGDNKLSGDDPEASLMQQISEGFRALMGTSFLPDGKMPELP